MPLFIILFILLYDDVGVKTNFTNRETGQKPTFAAASCAKRAFSLASFDLLSSLINNVSVYYCCYDLCGQKLFVVII